MGSWQKSDIMYVIMTLCDVVGRLFRGFRKKGAVRLGLFFAVASWCRVMFLTNQQVVTVALWHVTISYPYYAIG